MVVVLLLIAFAATVVPLETKALPVKNVCSSETVDSSKNKKSVSQLSLLISIVHMNYCMSFLLYISQSVFSLALKFC